MKTLHFHIEGIVQGVGFRPFVYHLAKANHLSGWVKNGSDGVHIEVSGPARRINNFRDMLRISPPGNAVIKARHEKELDHHHHGPFKIITSETSGGKKVLFTPDYGMCDDCEQELNNPADRRYRYPFITCTQCGPRYSIIRDLPYDRPNTTMDWMVMCDRCQDEYDSPENRRHFSQTNSCPDCAVTMKYYERDRIISNQDMIIDYAAGQLLEGKVVAVKGIGGFLLLCDATNEDSVQALRWRKIRPDKPFALMYPRESMIRRDAHITTAERTAIYSPESPIVLLRKRHEQDTGLAADAVAPGLNRIGVMRPYAPLLSLISNAVNRPLVATSANVSGSPIIYENKVALDEPYDIADGILVHNRDIIMAEDDSVVRFTRDGVRIILRRSRGLAPNYLPDVIRNNQSRLAVGASMKGTFALTQSSTTYVSQYLGDQDNYEAEESYHACLSHITNLLDFVPDVIYADMHPKYASTRYALELSRELDIPFELVQHHEAHFAAVLAENKLSESGKPVLGVIWDGTGYGHDGNIWGGEFMMFDGGKIEGFRRMKYFRHIMGDKMVREPRISALSILHESTHAGQLKQFFNDGEWNLYQGLLSKGTLKSSSMGRLFDAAACLLGICEVSTYEGEAPSLLEAEAERFDRKGQWEESPGDHLLDPAYHLLQVLLRKNMGIHVQENAYHFHYGLVRTIVYVARLARVKRIACSGGVFQNGLLVELLQSVPDIEVYLHKELSPNDENISFGQLAHADLRWKEAERNSMRKEATTIT